MKKLNDNSGFSLVEVIVVVAIMIVLISMLLPNVLGYAEKANRANAKANAEAIYSAAMAYVCDKIEDGETFEPGSELDVEVLWSEGVELISEDLNYDTVEIRLDAPGKRVKYVYYKSKNGAEVDYPVGYSGKIS